MLLDSKRPEIYSSFYVSDDVEDPYVFLDGHIWSKGISVRWYKPADKMHHRDTRNAAFKDNAENHDSSEDVV